MLISPIRVVQSIKDISETETSDLFNTARKYMSALNFYSSNFTLSVQDGEYAGQTIPHVHIHLIPRKMNNLKVNNDINRKDAFECNYNESNLKNNEIIYYDDESRIKRNKSYEEMEEEATYLRTYIQIFFIKFF